jgi:uncharacterized protein YqjF (DUF2071 family)
MYNSVQRLLSARELPNRMPVMYQRWDDLLFLHWSCRSQDLRSHIPSQLSLDLYDGQAYISIIAFRMNAVRPAGLSPLPWLSYFYELNVRVYVRDQRDEPGVYFLSLDCNRTLAVWIARTFFNLPYQRAVMNFEVNRSGQEDDQTEHAIACRRTACSDTAYYRWRVEGQQKPAVPGSLDFFLTERYNFFTVRKHKLLRGQVHHAPYNIGTASMSSWSDLPLVWNGIALDKRPPDLASCSAGVDVQAFSLVPACF